MTNEQAERIKQKRTKCLNTPMHECLGRDCEKECFYFTTETEREEAKRRLARDPKRIAEFIEKLGFFWETRIPDWRFGQFMSNFLGFAYENSGNDIFFIEDDEMLCFLEKFFESVT